jgi:hypothetical protein
MPPDASSEGATEKTIGKGCPQRTERLVEIAKKAAAMKGKVKVL